VSDWQSTAQKVLTRLLLGFALISIGFAAGKHAARSTGAHQLPEQPTGADVHDRGSTVVVYYMHATFRCVTCNTIEKMTRGLLVGEFAQELKAGTVRMEEVDFQKNEDLAKRYEVVASCVVVAHVRDGEEVAYQRLDEIWTLMMDPPAFNRYVGDAIRVYFSAGETQP
jgi:hypothetical protein